MLVSACGANRGLEVSVYCTAGDVQRYLIPPEARQQALLVLRPLGVSRLFLEGRRGDEYVAPSRLEEVRDYFQAKGIHCSGGIATVPGANFGVRQQGELGWLNWESQETRSGVARFFSENAPVFDELIVDDFYCTGDVSVESERACAGRAWGDYRRDLLVSLVEPLMIKPTHAASRTTRLIIKYPQWYDRFHLFGYDPLRMSPHFSQVWAGTEVRDPHTRRMGFVQPTEGYMNFRWLTAVAGRKVRGAWFDHIECSAQNFLDQACQSVLAGAQEITLFHLGDLMEGHPGDSALASRLPELSNLAASLRGKSRRGIAFYKPPGSGSDDNMYLADYLGMIGWPVLPAAKYPMASSVALLPVQAAGDPRLLHQMQDHLNRGATLVVTPALLRVLGHEAAHLAGVQVLADSRPVQAGQVSVGDNWLKLLIPLEMDAASRAEGCRVVLSARVGNEEIPLLTERGVGRGRICVLNVRTFSEHDFQDTKELLLAPRKLGLASIPQTLADALRGHVLSTAGLAEFQAPAGVGLVMLRSGAWVYNFLEKGVQVQFGKRILNLPAHGMAWVE